MNLFYAYQTFVQNVGGAFFPSACVDILLFLCKLKSCVRTKWIRPAEFALKKWCHLFSLYYFVDQEGFVYIASNSSLLQQVIKEDHKLEKHEKRLGVLLGYPLCCCEKMAEIGEENIDQFELEICSKGFFGEYQLIDPTKYSKGRAFISHVPCSTSCHQSLKIGKAFALILLNHSNFIPFSPWIKELQKIGAAYVQHK